MGFSRQEYWSGSPCASPVGIPDPGIEPRSPALQADSLPPSHHTSILIKGRKRTESEMEPISSTQVSQGSSGWPWPLRPSRQGESTLRCWSFSKLFRSTGGEGQQEGPHHSPEVGGGRVYPTCSHQVDKSCTEILMRTVSQSRISLGENSNPGIQENCYCTPLLSSNSLW